MKKIHLSIVSPEKELFEGEVNAVTLPGKAGSFTILPNHAPIVSSLKAGTVSYEIEGEESHTFDVNGGFMEFNENTASVCII